MQNAPDAHVAHIHITGNISNTRLQFLLYVMKDVILKVKSASGPRSNKFSRLAVAADFIF